VTARILHVSDLHVGRREESEPLAALHGLVAELKPELVLATGDLAHRGKRAQLERARDVLEELGAPVLPVPGNHDIPYTFPARFTRTFSDWQAVFGPPEQDFVSDRLVVAGLNSVRPWRQQDGGLELTSVRGLGARLAQAPANALRVVALHHHLAAPPWRAARKRPLHGRDRALSAFAEAGVELVVGGHVHQASVTERREFEVSGDSRTALLVLATAPGLGRPRPQRRGEALGLNAYEWDQASLAVRTWAWDGAALTEVGHRAFARG
jgi:3',5'-cyclic AMP phosphodiesterase CpdA